MDSIDQGARGIPMSSIAFNPPDVQLEWKALGAKFEGVLNDQSSEINGTFSQGPLQNMPLDFIRTNAPAAKL
jgi:hypothetical protein